MLKLRRYRQKFPRPRVSDLAEAVEEGLQALDLASRLPAGARVGITVGSRGIAGLPRLVATVAGVLRARGFLPFVVSAMGSHGGGTVEGQRAILAHLGVTEESVGCPLCVTSEAVEIGRTVSGWPVYCDAEAARADGILVVNRVKPHTSFRGSLESGLWKMMAVGLGKVPGATLVHRQGPGLMERVIREVGEVFLRNLPVAGGLAIVENAYEETALVRGFGPEEFGQETELLALARSLLPRLPVEEVDLLIVDEMGKNYSGTGMDVNVIGRWRVQGMPEPETPCVRRLVVLRLSDASQGNANGIGLADITTRRLVDKIDFPATYLNAVTTTFFMRVAIPMTVDSDREALETALRSLGDGENARVIRIRNTRQLDEFWASPPVYAELAERGATPVGEETTLRFDERGNLVDLTA